MWTETWTPRNAHILVPGTSECYLTWQKKEGFVVGVTQLRILKWGNDPGICERDLNVIKSVPVRTQEEI